VLVEGAMLEFLTKLLLIARSRLKSQARLEAKKLILRQQVIVLSRKSSSGCTDCFLNSECDHCYQVRDRYPMASARLSSLLAVEIPPT
jgi:hypothetical protein